MNLQLDLNSKTPIYKQLVSQIEKALRDGELKPGELLPSMNDIAAEHGISRETAKKAYGILTEKGIVLPKQGKGFYAADSNSGRRPQVLVIFDKFSVYKQILFNSFAGELNGVAEVTILNHDQNIDLLQYYLDKNLDSYDYYVIAPHFPLDAATQERVVKQFARIPNRKLIMLDRLLPGYPGNYGAVYQDFENDIYDGLVQGLNGRFEGSRLRVITLPASLYGPQISRGIKRFCQDYDVPVEFLSSAPARINAGDTFLVLNSQLDAGLVDLARNIQACGLQIGKDVRIISYNESDMNELVLGGLTTVSADFKEMGCIAARMILDKQPAKVHCPFRMYRRNSY